MGSLHPLLRAAALPFAALAVALFLVALRLAFYHADPSLMYDARVYQRGAQAVLGGQALYGDLYAGRPGPPFTYTPFAAIVFLPLVGLSGLTLAAVWTLLSALSLEGSIWICLGWAGLTEPRLRLALTAAVSVLALGLDPVSVTLELGQVNLILMLAVLLDLSLSDGSRWKGAGIGLASGVKLVPGFFVLYLLVTRRFRAAGTAAAVWGATIAAGWAVLPRDSLDYWGGTILKTHRVGDPQNVHSQSLASLLARWFHTSQGFLPVWILLCLLIAAATLLLAAQASRRRDELLAACICASATLLISPITWEHHWVWVVPFLVWLGNRAWRSRSALLGLAAAAVAVEFYVSPYRAVPKDMVLNLHLDLWQLLATSTYAFSALLFLVLIARMSWKDRRPAASTR